MNYEVLRKKLMLLDVEKIAQFRDKHPGKLTLTAFCNSIIAEKEDAKEMAELNRELDALLENKKRPIRCCNTEQGNETR